MRAQRPDGPDPALGRDISVQRASRAASSAVGMTRAAQTASAIRDEPQATGCPAPAAEGRPSGRRGLRRRRLAPAPVELDPSAADPPPKAPIRPLRSGHLAKRARPVFSGAKLENFVGRAGGRRAHALAGSWAQANSPCGVGVRRTVTPSYP